MSAAREPSAQARGQNTGASGRESVATRQCAVSRAQLPVDALIRFVVGPNGSVVPDLKRRLPGRGVWLTCNRGTVDHAVQKGHFSRAFKRRVEVSADLGEQVESLLRQATLSRLSLANKAGAVTCGFAKVEQALGKGRVAGLMHAREAAADGCRKLDAKLRKEAEKNAAPARIIRRFNADELSLALGRSNVVHAAVIDDRSSCGLFEAIDRLEAYSAKGAVCADAPGQPGRGEE